MSEHWTILATCDRGTRAVDRQRRRNAAGVALGLVTILILIGADDLRARQIETGDLLLQNRPLKIFLDCAECDADYQRRTVTFVDFVRDRAVADLHVLVTTQDTGGGGLLWTVRFIGLGPFHSQDRTFSFSTEQRATSDDRRRDFGRVFKIGLVGYAASTAVAPELDVSWRRPPRMTAETDRWGSWLFRINGGGNISGEELTTIRSHRMSVAANHTTADWKLNVTASGNVDTRRFTVGGDRRLESRRESWALGSQAVKSVGGHAGAGLRASIGRSSFSNTDRVTTVASGLEYDLFPYRDASTRSLTFQYTVGTSVYEYREVTIFDKLTERIPHHALTMSLGVRAPWGLVGAYATASQHLNHKARHRMTIAASTDVNLFNGLAFNMAAEVGRFNDLISLRKGNASTEEILLRQQQLATDHRYSFTIGATYSFGSIFNTIVNPRFGGPGGLAIY